MGRCFWARTVFVITLISAARTEAPAQTDYLTERPRCGTHSMLAEAWLRFHVADLCADVEASFAFHDRGMEVRSVVKESKALQKLQQILDPLRSSFQIELHATRPKKEKESEDGANPPPSLWQNYELRSHLGDPSARLRVQSDFESAEDPDLADANKLLKARLLAFAEQVLDWSRKLERYAAHLPALVSMAQENCWPHELRVLAASACKAHSQNIQKYAQKLDRNLIHALPKSTARGQTYAPRTETPAAASLLEAAFNLAAAAQSAAGRIRNFIYPERHTVDLKELHRSSLLESLRELQVVNTDFQKALSKATKK